MAQYLLSVWHDSEYEVDFSSDDAKRMVEQVGAFNAELEAAGAWLFAGGLHPAGSASVFRAEQGDSAATAGPYAADSPQMGGFWIIDVEDEASAAAWAKRAAAACEGPVELRPLQGS